MARQLFGVRSVQSVPEITVFFWLIKGLSTAMGESTSDFMVHAMPPIAAVLVGFAGFTTAMVIQLRMRRYVAWAYWLAVVMVGVFGTMVADVLHVGFDVPYWMSAALFAATLAAIFLVWRRAEGTLRVRHCGRRSERRHPAPGLLRLRAAFRRLDRYPGHRVRPFPLECDLRVLARLRAHSAARRIRGRLARQAGPRGRNRGRQRTGRSHSHADDRRARRVPLEHSTGCRGAAFLTGERPRHADQAPRWRSEGCECRAVAF